MSFHRHIHDVSDNCRIYQLRIMKQKETQLGQRAKKEKEGVIKVKMRLHRPIFKLIVRTKSNHLAHIIPKDHSGRTCTIFRWKLSESV